MEQYFVIGKIVNTHGIKGEVKVFPLTDDIKRFEKLDKVFIEFNNELVKHEITSIKYFKNLVILKFNSINDMTQAEKLKESYLKINRSDAIELPEDSYFISDLIGLDVKTCDGEHVGKLTNVLQSGGNDIYEIQDNNNNFLIPAVKEFIKKIDLENKIIIVELIEGLKDL